MPISEISIAQIFMKRHFNISESSMKWFIIIISLPALFINLGLFPLISDEPTRGAVTLEMIFSGNFIQPTIGGELYFNKPPLFNWLQVLFINLAGSMDEWVFRLPSVLSVIALSLLTYSFTKKQLGNYALVAALGFLTAGRVLFWDSFMGLIDLTYSLVTFGSFAWMIHYNSKSKYLLFFLGSYLLAGLGFLLKGIPSVAFQVLSVTALLIYDRKVRSLFSWKHLAGIAVFLLIVGSYYLTYARQYPLFQAFETLITQSNRFQTKSGEFANWFLHLVSFPFNILLEFAPVTILSLLLLNKQVWIGTFNHRFYRYLLLIFLVNILIYWFSADMRSRYLFMFIPIVSIILVKAYSVAADINLKIYRVFQNVLLVSTFLVVLSLLVYPVWNETRNFQGVILICTLLFLIGLGLTLIAYYNRKFVLLSLFGVLLLARIGFNLYNLPARLNSFPDLSYKQGEIKAARQTIGQPLYILSNTDINHDAIFYISRERGNKLERTYELQSPDSFYLVDHENLSTFAWNENSYKVVDSFKIKLNESTIFLVKKLK